MSLERLIRIQANENGPFTSSNKNFSITIPSHLSYVDLDRSYIELSIRLTTTDPDAGTGEGVYPANLRYKSSNLPLYNAGLLRRCNLTSDNQGRLESINDINVLVSNLNQMTMSRSEKESIGFKSCYQTYDKYGNKNSIFTNLNKEGAELSSQQTARVPIMLKDLFGVAKIEGFDVNYSGDLVVRCELDIANIQGIVDEPDNLALEATIPFTSHPSVKAVTLTDGGTGYAVGDTGDLTGGTGSEAKYRVATEAGGVVATIEITDSGLGYKVDDVLTLAGHGGADATFTVSKCSNEKFISTDDAVVATFPDFAVGRQLQIVGDFNTVAFEVSREVSAIAQDTATPAKVRLTVSADVQEETASTDVVNNLEFNAYNARLQCDDITAVGGGNQTTFDLKKTFPNTSANVFYIGQKVEYNGLYTPTGGGATEEIEVVRLIDSIAINSTTDKITITLNSGVKTLAVGDSLTNSILIPTHTISGQVPAVSNIDYIRADCVVVQKMDGMKSDGYEYMTYDVQNLNGNNNTDYNQQITLPNDCSSALVVFKPSGGLYSDNSTPEIQNWRCRVDGEFTSDREVKIDSPLYHDLIGSTLLNMNMDYSNNRGITSTIERDFIIAETGDASQLAVVGVHCPLTNDSKNLQINVNSTNGVGEVICYKHLVKQM
tara:strand:- start:24 stop:2003 length:1980 start_codon:yes stop_codon:yes gene_type:complete